MGLENIRNVVLVLSGKGGVGKSSVTIQLALSLTQQGHNVGILDIDLTGPSIPRLLNLEDQKVRQAPGGWLPVRVHDALVSESVSAATTSPASTSEQDSQSTPGKDRVRGSLHALSLAFLLPSRSSAVIWRGPKKTAMIRQFVSDVLWPEGTDYLLIDTPPGTSDEHIAIVEELHKLSSSSSDSITSNSSSPSSPTKLAGAVVVTTPQAISTSDVRKELNFCVKTQVPVIGVIENMAGYMCPCCGEISNVFSKGGGEIMARECGVRFLGSVPVDTGFGALVEGAVPDVDVVNGDLNEAEAHTESENSSTSTKMELSSIPSTTSTSDQNGGAMKISVPPSSSSQPQRPSSSSPLLVEKYKECGLSPLFADFTTTIVKIIHDNST